MVIRRWFLPLLIIFVLIAALGCQAIASTTVTGSGKPETRDFNLTGFSGIQAATAFVLQVDRADSYKVQITADNNLWEVLDISVSGNTLNLHTKPGASVRNSALKAIVTLPSLRSLDLSGATRASVTGFVSNEDMTAKISGASILAIDNVKFDSTVLDVSGAGKISGNATLTKSKITVSGAGTVDLIGSGESASMEVSGGSRVTLDQFELQTVSINISGGSQARINSHNITSADISGASHLYYADSPILGKIQTSGGSSISQE